MAGGKESAGRSQQMRPAAMGGSIRELKQWERQRQREAGGSVGSAKIRQITRASKINVACLCIGPW